MTIGGITVVVSSLLRLSVDFCARSEDYSECQWNCFRNQQFIVIACGIVVVISSLLRLSVELW